MSEVIAKYPEDKDHSNDSDPIGQSREGHDHDRGDQDRDEREHEGRDKNITVVITYNGLNKPIKVQESDTIAIALAQAIVEFGPLPSPHMLSLFTVAGTELADNQTVKQTGLHSGDKLLLRPSQVKGGSV